jgi:hypothetical protein
MQVSCMWCSSVRVHLAYSSAAESRYFTRVLIIIWSRAVNVRALDSKALILFRRGLSRISYLWASVTATCISIRVWFSMPISSILCYSAACSCACISHAYYSRKTCALASSASHYYRSRSIWAHVAILLEAVDSELDPDPWPTIIVREV